MQKPPFLPAAAVARRVQDQNEEGFGRKMLLLAPLLVGFAAFLFAWYILNMQRARSKLPAGPAPLPVIGNLALLGFQLHPETLLKVQGTKQPVVLIRQHFFSACAVAPKDLGPTRLPILMGISPLTHEGSFSCYQFFQITIIRPIKILARMKQAPGHQVYANLIIASKYGDICTLWLGRSPVVVLSGFQAVKDALINHSEDFADRPILPFQEDLLAGASGIIFSNGHTWKQQRRFILMALQKQDLRKKSLDCIQQEASSLIQAFAQEQGRPMDPYSPLLSSVNKVISTLLFGRCFFTGDKNFHCLMNGTKALPELLGSFWMRLYDAFPGLMKHLQPVLNRTLTGLAHWKDLKRLVQEEIQEHRKSWSPEEPRDFIDLYLAQLEKSRDDPTSAFTESNMTLAVIDLFLAGLDSSTFALHWALLYMIAHPEIQERVQEELDTALSPTHVIRYEDRKILPFTNAVIHETQRCSSTSALGVIRRCTKDTTVQGWPISKGTTIIPNIFSVHYDHKQWETPRKFNPGHFLDTAGNFIQKEAFLPFSGGARVCLAEKLARTTLFVLFSSLLRAFRFQPPEGVTEMNLQPILGIILQPHPYKARAIPRYSA